MVLIQSTISNIDLSTIPTLDGGDDTLIADGFIDTLTLSNTSVATTELLNWEKIVLDATTFASPNNTLSTGTDAGYGLFLTNGSLLNAGTTFNLTGNLDIDSTSTFQGYGAGSGVYAVSGSVTNAGTITTQDGAAGDVITVGGDYTGVSGSTYKIDTVLGNDSSITDNLAITGNASGATAINVANVGGTGAQTSTGIKVVSVGGTSGATFTLASPVQAGAYEYTLFKNGETNWMEIGI
jgi:type V secretory pathway adhesin AidA